MEQFHPRHEGSSDHSFRFLSYAKTNCLFHTVCALEQEEYPDIDDSLLRLLRGTMLDVGTCDGQRLLLVAAAKGIKSILRILLESGKVDPNSTDASGRTPLFLAAAHGHQAIITDLLGVSAININLQSKNGQTPLYKAIEMKHITAAEILIESTRADLNAKDGHGRTPLHTALECIETDSIARLLL